MAARKSSYNYQPRDRSTELPPYGTTPQERTAYRKAVRAQQERDREVERQRGTA